MRTLPGTETPLLNFTEGFELVHRIIYAEAEDSQRAKGFVGQVRAQRRAPEIVLHKVPQGCLGSQVHVLFDRLRAECASARHGLLGRTRTQLLQ